MNRSLPLPRQRSTLRLIGTAVAPAACILVIVYFMGAAVLGRNGVLKWGDYRAERQTAEETLSRLDRQRAQLWHRSALLDPRHTDPDYAEELVRRRTDQVRADEVIIPLR